MQNLVGHFECSYLYNTRWENMDNQGIFLENFAANILPTDGLTLAL